MRTWLDVPDDDPFGVDHLPVGVLSHPSHARFAAVRIGGYALDLSGAGDYAPLFAEATLDPFLAAGAVRVARCPLARHRMADRRRTSRRGRATARST